ncbi:MAG: hypothetical protein ACMXYL_04055 [Candidatus Woesearchaeota archaeon]
MKFLFFALLIIVIISIILWIQRGISDNNDIDTFEYSDYIQRNTIYVMVYEYIGIDDLYPNRFGRVYEKERRDDTIDCYSFLHELQDTLNLQSLECEKPAYWKGFYYDYDFSNISLGYRIFHDSDSAKAYYSSLIDPLGVSIEDSELIGGLVESRVSIIPFELGHAVDDITMYSLADNSTDYPTYYLISLILSYDTVYTVLERSDEPIERRRFMTSFRPENHDSYLASRTKKLLD